MLITFPERAEADSGPGERRRHPLITVAPRYTPRDTTLVSQLGWNETGPQSLPRSCSEQGEGEEAAVL